MGTHPSQEDPYKRIVDNLTTTEKRELESLRKHTSRLFRDFWVRAMKRQGWSVKTIAEEMEMSEASVYAILKQEKAA